MQIIVFIEDPLVVEKILAYLNVKASASEVLPRPRCLVPPQRGLFDVAGWRYDDFVWSVRSATRQRCPPFKKWMGGWKSAATAVAGANSRAGRQSLHLWAICDGLQNVDVHAAGQDELQRNTENEIYAAYSPLTVVGIAPSRPPRRKPGSPLSPACRSRLGEACRKWTAGWRARPRPPNDGQLSYSDKRKAVRSRVSASQDASTASHSCLGEVRHSWHPGQFGRMPQARLHSRPS